VEPLNQQKNLNKFKNLLSKEGLITTRNFFNPCSNVRAITKEKFDSQEEQRTHERIHKKAQESWTLFDEEKMSEPGIVEFIACLSLDFLYEEYISEDLHGMLMKDIEQGILGNQDYIESWFKTFIEP
jgi:hypothetical protein